MHWNQYIHIQAKHGVNIFMLRRHCLPCTPLSALVPQKCAQIDIPQKGSLQETQCMHMLHMAARWIATAHIHVQSYLRASFVPVVHLVPECLIPTVFGAHCL